MSRAGRRRARVLALGCAAAVAVACAAGAGAAVPTLRSLAPREQPISVCPPPAAAAAAAGGRRAAAGGGFSAAACAGFEAPQLAGRVPGDDATLCFHLGCCYDAGAKACARAPTAGAACAGAAEEAEWFGGNQPVPALANLRGGLQLPLETGDALAVDCVHFPPVFGTCDGRRSDVRFDRAAPGAAPVNPTFGGATQRLRVNGAALRATAYRWEPAEVVRRAAAFGLPWLEANTTVRMVPGRAEVLLAVDLANAGVGEQGVDVQFELPFVGRLYAEVEKGYEATQPNPLNPRKTEPPHGARDASDWTFEVQDAGRGVVLQTALDSRGADGGADGLLARACTAAAVRANLGSGVVLERTEWGFARARTNGTLATGARARIEISLAVGMGAAAGPGGACNEAIMAATAAAASFGSSWDAIPRMYEQRWQAAFDPADNTFEGNLPTLETDDAELARTYYGSLMSMFLVEKLGIDATMRVERASAMPAVGGCAGTYVSRNATGGLSPPFSLMAGGKTQGFDAMQFAGRSSAPWYAGEATVAMPSGVVEMRFDGGEVSADGTIAGVECERIVWSGGGTAPNKVTGEEWVRLRPAGEWDIFVAAGALLGTTALYLWDTSGASMLWSMLSPTSLRTVNDLLLSGDLLAKNADDYIAMAQAGKYYAFSPVAGFQSGANELRTLGRAATEWRSPLTNATRVEHLVNTANLYERLPTLAGTDLPDWGGDPTNFLECQETYLHGVAALQASTVWMLREAAAAIRATSGNITAAAEMEARAGALLKQILPLLQRGPDGGWWWMLYPPSEASVASHARGGPTAQLRRVEGRFIHDFLYVAHAIAGDLDDGQRADMVAFFKRELRTPNFVRAMSQHDPSAKSTSSVRSDHSQWGSWDGWVGGAIGALAELGALDEALDLARSIGALLDEGPFGQAHRVFGPGEGAGASMVRPARKDQSWAAVCAAYIADGIVRGLFGFAPALADFDGKGGPRLRDAEAARSFKGNLRHVRYRGELYTLTAGKGGVQAVKED